jgi:hypothetical protein
VEAYELTARGGASEFARIIDACEAFGPYCLIGGLAVNCYVEPVYTLDAEIVIVEENLPELTAYLKSEGFSIEPLPPNSVNAVPPGSDLRVQFTTDDRYQPFPARAIEGEVLGIRVKAACLLDVTQGKLWTYSSPRRRLSKRKKDELDLIRLAEAFPQLKMLYPLDLQDQLDRG